MDQDEMKEHVDQYIQLIDQLLPYPRVIKSEALRELTLDVSEAWDDLASQHPDPEERFQALMYQFGTPEEVAKNLCQANEWHQCRVGFFPRTIAYFVDGILSLILAVMTTIPIYVFHATEEPSNLLELAFRLLILLTFGTLSSLVFIGYFVIFEGKYSTTPGKWLLKLKVVSEFGIKITWQQAIIRNFTRIRGELLLLDLLIGKFVMKLDRQRAMDKLAQTIVIKIKIPRKKEK